jgi:hypothetical protein
MNSMFGKQFEPLTSSERMKQKRNCAIYQTLATSKNISLDVSKNIRKAVNYESYMNAVNGFYESMKMDISKNRDCFNVQLMKDTDVFKINTFDDVHNSFVDFDNAQEPIHGIETHKVWNGTQYDDKNTDKGFVVYAADISGVSSSNFHDTETIERSADIIYPYTKKGVCSKLIVPKLTYFDPSGNSGKTARDIKYFFPMSKFFKKI